MANQETFKEPNPEIVEKLEEANSWRNNRMNEYNNLNQHEMIYDDIKAGKLSEEGEWYKVIDGIKTKHPKPDNLDSLNEEIELMIKAEREAEQE